MTREGLWEDKRRYDLLGRLTYREAAPGRGYHFRYGAQGRLSSIKGPDGEVIEERSYDMQSGELKRVKDPRTRMKPTFIWDKHVPTAMMPMAG